MAKSDVMVLSGIGRELLLRKSGKAPVHRLEFDPSSGELRLSASGVVRPQPASEATFVDQIASDGFA
jgi:hypothetical protein